MEKLITKNSLKWMLPIFIALLVIPALPFVLDYYVFVLSLIGIYTIVAIGFNIMSGYTGLISIGHAGFFAIGAYTAAILVDREIVPFIVALPLAACLTGVIGFLLALPCLRLFGMYIAMATLAFGFIVEETVLQLNALTGGHQGLAVPAATIGGFNSGFVMDSDKKFYYFILAMTLLFIFIALNIVRTKYGRAFLAIRESEIAASTMGIDLTKYKTMSFTISAFYTGIAGALFGNLLHYIAPNAFTIFLSFQFLVMIVVGGFASVVGSIMGAVFLTALPEFMSSLQEWQIIVFGLILLFFILFVPYGLAGLIKGIQYKRALRTMEASELAAGEQDV
jgi:branched-chain amino acid transport system permease protein